MYSREVGGEVREFGVSGKLWHGVLVMFDRTTDSLWTQLDGRAIQGDELGARLEHVPSSFTTWERWKRKHPDTLVLEKDFDEREQSESHYASYFADPDKLFMEHLDEGIGGVGPKDTVFGVLIEGHAVAVSERLLQANSSAVVFAGGWPVAFARDPETGDVVATVDSLHVEPQTLRVDRAFWYAWKRTHPKSLVLTD